MFSLSAARILDKEANESNYKAVLTQLTGLHLTPIENELEVENEQENPSMLKIGTMGGNGASPHHNS